jgi:transposase-like protein
LARYGQEFKDKAVAQGMDAGDQIVLSSAGMPVRCPVMALLSGRLVLHEWNANELLAPQTGSPPETLRRRVRQQERDTGQRPRRTTAEDERIKALEREVRELRKANEILHLASAFFTQAALDRHFKS